MLLIAVSLPEARGETPEAWAPERTTSPATVEEAKALQAKVRQIAERATLSTVALQLPAGMGSGVIVSEDGLVLTVSNVMRQPGRSVNFVLHDGTTVRGKTLGLNAKTDTAMARIIDPPPKGASWPGAAEGKWPAAPLGKSKDLTKGQWVIGLGHSGGLRRDRPPPVRLGRFDTHLKADAEFRTDVTIVGGDSGGPLFDLHGRVVGIHTRLGLLVGITMHVPVETFRDEWERLKAGEVIGKAARAETGMDLEGLTPIVKALAAGGPAEGAGLKVGDVVASLDGESVASATDVALIVGGLNPGQVVPVVVRRGTSELSLKLTLGGNKDKAQ
jgi:serine protease Do